MTQRDQRVGALTGRATGLALTLVSPCHIGPAWRPPDDWDLDLDQDIRALVSGTGPAPPHIEVAGIWDTGATGTVISQGVVDRCQLQQIGFTEVGTADGKRTVPTYQVSLVLDSGIMLPSITVACGDFAGDVLIGMDVISNGDFAVTNYQGETQFTFRHPSQGHIDFTSRPQPPLNRAERRRRKRGR